MKKHIRGLFRSLGWRNSENGYGMKMTPSFMFCTLCEKHTPKDSNFVKGCLSLHIESLKKYESSKVHVRSLEVAKTASAPPGMSGSIQHSIHHLNEEAVTKLKILFRTAHALAKHCRPFRDYKWMCALDEKKGMDIGQTYCSDVKCREFTNAIVEVEHRKLETNLFSRTDLLPSCVMRQVMLQSWNSWSSISGEVWDKLLVVAIHIVYYNHNWFCRHSKAGIVYGPIFGH